MSELIRRVPRSGFALSLALAAAALVVASVGDRSDRTNKVGGTVQFELPADAPWCGPADRLGVKTCRYSSFEDCLAAVRPDYRTCRPNPAAVVSPDDAPYWTYRSVFLSP
jgi:hypothetical protein